RGRSRGRGRAIRVVVEPIVGIVAAAGRLETNGDLVGAVELGGDGEGPIACAAGAGVERRDCVTIDPLAAHRTHRDDKIAVGREVRRAHRDAGVLLYGDD